MDQDLKQIAVLGGLALLSGGQVYGYMVRGKGKGNAAARDRAALMSVVGAGATAIGTGVMLWPVLRRKFKNDGGSPHEGTEAALPGGRDDVLPFLPPGSDQVAI